MATNCIKVPRFLAQAAPRAVPGWLMCNSTGAAAAAAPDRSATNLWRVCTTWDTDLGMRKHGGQAVRMGNSGWAASPRGDGSGAGLGLQDMDPVSRVQ